MDKHNHAVPGENKVRGTWQVSAMKTEPISTVVKETSHANLRDSVTAPYAGHHLTSLFR